MSAWLLIAASVAVPPSDAWVSIPQRELQGSYDQLWAVSDVHGHREELERLLRSAHLATPEVGGELHWDAHARRQLLVVAGDLISAGPDSPGVIRLVARLRAEAPAAQSRVVVLLGNAEMRHIVRSQHPKRLFREAPVAAFVGPWLFAHSGYIDARGGEAPLRAWLDEVVRRWNRGGHERYEQFLTGHSIVDCHEWWRSRRNREAMREDLQLLGLDAVIFGHDPWALGASGTIALGGGGTLLKLDTGLKQRRSAGMLLRCDVAEALRRGLSACRASLPDGTLVQLPSGPSDR